jgi:pimeloyl-ACP methyl ester carboxylesterase
MALDVTETAHVRRTDVPVVLIRADNGLVDDAMADLILDRLGPSASVRVIPDCGHHVLLERPAELVAELERALATG